MASVGTPARTRASTLGIRVNLGLCGTAASYFLVRRCALMIRFTKAAGPGQRTAPPLFSMLFFTGAYFTYSGILALALYLKPEGSWGKSFRSLVRCHTSHGVIYC